MSNQIKTTLSAGAVMAAAFFVGGCAGNTSSPSAMPQTQSISHGIPAQQNYNGPPEIFNIFEYAPPGESPTNFEITFSGDWTSEIGSQQLTQPYDPFCAIGDTCTPGVSFDGSVTTVEWFGQTLYQNSLTGYHFGLIGEQSSAYIDGCTYIMECEAQTYWSYPSAPHIVQPFVPIEVIHPRVTGKKWLYAEVYVSVTDKPGTQAVFGNWELVPYVPDGTKQPKLKFSNYGTEKLYVVSSGIIPGVAVPNDPDCLKNPSCPEDMDLLASLNYAGSPPPGYSGSRFIPLTNPPPKVLKPTKPR